MAKVDLPDGWVSEGDDGESIAHIQVNEGEWFQFAERLSELTEIPVQYPDE